MSDLTDKVRRYLETMSDIGQAERFMDEIYSQDVVFQDPIQRLEGLAAFKGMHRKLMKGLKDLRVEVEGVTASDEALTVHWVMSFRVRLSSRRARVPMVSWMELDPDGRCTFHVDYWDFLGVMDQMIPGFRPVGNLIRKIAS
jgi:hypothetical protein